MVYTVEVYGLIPVNAYFFVNDKGRGFLIDPGSEAKELVKFANEKELAVEKILLTHGHFDHMGAAREVSNFFHAPIYMLKGGEEYVKDAERNFSAACGVAMTLEGVNYLEAGARIALEGDESFGLKLIATPGHTKDGVTYYSEQHGVAFVGDTIFKGSFGRTDLYGGDEKELFDSIRQKIFSLPGETKLYSGHSDVTTVGAEKNGSFWQFVAKM